LLLNLTKNAHACERSDSAILEARLFAAGKLSTSEVIDTLDKAVLHGIVHHSEADLHTHFISIDIISHIHLSKIILFKVIINQLSLSN